jgi:rubrerythrin
MNASLKKAYELEVKGLEFYVSKAAVVVNPLARRTLLSLAQAEISHMLKIDEISAEIDKTGKWPAQDTAIKFSDIEMSVKEYFQKAGKTVIDADKGGSDIIKEAMEFERISHDLYSSLNERATMEPEKRLYAALRDQETEHFAALENVYYYLTSSGDWFAREESKAWNWMNL